MTRAEVQLRVTGLPAGWLQLSPVGYSDAFRDSMRAVPGAQWIPGRRFYALPIEAWPCIEQLIRAEICGVISNTAPPPTPKRGTALRQLPKLALPEGLKLRSYQREGARFLLDRVYDYGAALLADDPGLGKTAQFVYFARAMEADNLVILAPSVVLGQWQSELAKWWPSMCSTVISSRKDIDKLEAIASDPGVPSDEKAWHNMTFILSYDFFRSNSERLLKVLPVTHGIGLDEIHYIQNSTSKRSKAARALCDRDRKSTWTVGLSGTPMTSRPRDLWHPLDVLFPKRFGRFIPFAIRYCDGHQEEVTREKLVWVTTGKSNEEELGERLSHLMIRRSRVDVLRDLPERNRIVIPVEPPASKRKRLAEIALQKGNPATMRKALRIVESYKVTAAAELARDLVEQGSKVLIFTMTRGHAFDLADLLDVPAVVGSGPNATPSKKRREKLLHSCAKSSIGVATMFSVTTGIDLFEFDTAIFVGLDWVPANLLQAEARVHRIGQTRNVNVYYLVALGTLDEVIREQVIGKLDSFATILGGAAEQTQMKKDLKQYNEEQLLDQIVEMVMKQRSAA